ncbi:MAG: dienelactone hydrolase family protein [Candidatus Dadabacteria bacterium]
MKHFKFALICLAAFFSSCNNNASTSKSNNKDSMNATADSSSIKEEKVSYSANGTTSDSYITYSEQVKGKRPVVLVIPEWWGLNDYARMRAKMLAQLGYLAMAVDMYGDGRMAADPKAAMNLATPFWENKSLGKERLDAALNYVKKNERADSTRTAAIGYCFGGFVVLNSANLGSDLDGVVSFHGGLDVVPPPKGMKTRFLICHGASDASVPPEQVNAFKKSMDSAAANYIFKSYPDATHAFTNPASDEVGKKFNLPIRYNEEADHASWDEMKRFLQAVFKS